MALTHPDQDGTPLVKQHVRPHWRYTYLCVKVLQAKLLEEMLQQARNEMARNVRTMGKKLFEKNSETIKRFEPS